ncbi:MAG: response regulator transcription factor [Eubacteriales bacterium]|nr:response regulator transcription factor [Eubacteriales bacterium]
MSKILLVEDDLSLVNGLSIALTRQGYEVEVARTLQNAKASWQNSHFDLIVLDVSLPDGVGFDFCKEVRAVSKTPIVFLTAADEETDVIMGLDLGGDDYITKPFKLAVFLSRIHALLRRSEQYAQTDPVLSSNSIQLDLLGMKASKNGASLSLTSGEFRLLRLFMENPGCVLSSEQILSKLWDCKGDFVNGNTLTVYIRRLRAKIEDDPANPQWILTVRGVGYQWNAKGACSL